MARSKIQFKRTIIWCYSHCSLRSWNRECEC